MTALGAIEKYMHLYASDFKKKWNNFVVTFCFRVWKSRVKKISLSELCFLYIYSWKKPQNTYSLDKLNLVKYMCYSMHMNEKSLSRMYYIETIYILHRDHIYEVMLAWLTPHNYYLNKNCICVIISRSLLSSPDKLSTSTGNYCFNF